MVPRENKNNPFAKFWRTNKEYYGIFESGLLNDFQRFLSTIIVSHHFKWSMKSLGRLDYIDINRIMPNKSNLKGDVYL